MNFAHLHLIMNHIPIIGLPLVLVFFVYSLWVKNRHLQFFSLLVLVGVSALVLPVFLTGEPAEKWIEHLPEITEAVIEPHEDMAKLAMIFTLATGGMALLGLWFRRDERKSKVLHIFVLTLGIIATVLLLRTGLLGGQIRHIEIRAGSSDQPPASAEK